MEPQRRSKTPYVGILVTLVLLAALWAAFSVGRVVTGHAPWGPKIGGSLPDGTDVYFQARPAGFETDDRLTVIAPGKPPVHYLVDQVHGGFERVAVKYDDTGHQVWVESDGKVGASIDLAARDFRAEMDTQHTWAVYGSGSTLDEGATSSVLSWLSPW